MEKFESISVRTEDLIRRCEKQYTPQFTHFLTPEEQAHIKMLASEHHEIFLVFYGGVANSERCMAGFFPCDIFVYPESEDERRELEALFEIEYVEISGSGFVNFSHRDVLGSLMSLGVKRETIGDIIVTDDSKNAYVAVLPGIAVYICTSLERVARDKVRVKCISSENVPEKRPSPRQGRSTSSARKANSCQINNVQVRNCSCTRGRRVKETLVPQATAPKGDL